MSFFSKQKNIRRGFTLIELLVVLMIIVSLSGVLLANYASFESRTEFENFVLDAALMVREAQVSSIAASENRLNQGGGEFDFGQGVYFEAAPSNKTVLFVDEDNNLLLSDTGCPTGGECVRAADFSFYTISSICTQSTYGGGTDCGKNDVTVTFKRPGPGAHITETGAEVYYSATIEFMSQQGLTKSIQIFQTGQLSAN